MTSKKSLLLLLPLFLAAVLLVTSTASGQSGTSSALAGTVVDSTGASLVGAKITATDIQTSAVRTGATDSVGHYLLSQVNPGTYQVSVASSGFGVAVSEATAVGVGRTVTLNFTLSVGSASQMTAFIPVEGMSCGSCAATVKRTLKAISGVTEAEVSLEQRGVKVRYLESKVAPEQMAAAINQAGYKAGTPRPER